MGDRSTVPLSDYAAPPVVSTSPPAVKVQREIGTTIRDVAIVVAVTTGLLAGKLEPTWFVLVLVALMMKQKGIGEKALIDLVELVRRGRS
jgi:hypothetical protein